MCNVLYGGLPRNTDRHRLELDEAASQQLHGTVSHPEALTVIVSLNEMKKTVKPAPLVG